MGVSLTLADYSLSVAAGTALPVLAPTTVIAAGISSDTLSAAQSIGFSFRFCGQTFTTFRVSSRGYMVLGSSGGPADSDNTILHSGSDQGEIIAPWWDHTQTADSTGFVRFDVRGDGLSSERCIIEWSLYAQAAQTATNHHLLTLQVVLWAATGEVSLTYAKTTTGTPVETGYSASMGFHAEGVYRDLSTFDHSLGGTDTTSDATLDAGTAEFPDGMTYTLAPAIPVVSAFTPLGFEEITQTIDQGGDPLDTIGQNLNWLYANHSPPLLNVTPVSGAAGTEQFVLPVWPSSENLDYVATYGATTVLGCEAEVELSYATIAEPQPGTGAHWTHADTTTWNPVTRLEATGAAFALPNNATHILLECSTDGNAWDLNAFMLHPQVMETGEVGIPVGTDATYISGQMLDGAQGPIQTEALNRLYVAPAITLGKRAQMLFSFAENVPASPKAGGNAHDYWDQLVVASPTMPGQEGAVVRVVVCAAGTAADDSITITDEGGESVELVIGDTSTAYAYVWSTLTLRSDRPVITATAGGTGGVTPLFIAGFYRPGYTG